MTYYEVLIQNLQLLQKIEKQYKDENIGGRGLEIVQDWIKTLNAIIDEEGGK